MLTCKRREHTQQKGEKHSESLEENEKTTASQKPREERVSNGSSVTLCLHETEEKETKGIPREAHDFLGEMVSGSFLWGFYHKITLGCSAHVSYTSCVCYVLFRRAWPFHATVKASRIRVGHSDKDNESQQASRREHS